MSVSVSSGIEGSVDRLPGRVVRAVAGRLLALAMLLAIAGCNLLPETRDETSGWNADRLFRRRLGCVLRRA